MKTSQDTLEVFSSIKENNDLIELRKSKDFRTSIEKQAIFENYELEEITDDSSDEEFY